MREIKFRGKTKSGYWIYGTPVFYKNGDVCIYNSRCENYGCEATSIAEMRTNVIAETVGEYTGLKDKDGKDIYEGDIVKSTAYRNIKLKIIFVNGAFRANGKMLIIRNVLLNNLDNPEVIGNIFENQDLLK